MRREDKPIFVNGDVYNSTVNDILARHCKAAKIPVISVHGLRHTHASLLLFAGVSIASVARRLGHAIGIVEENIVLKEWYASQGFIHTGTQKFDFFPFTCGYMEKTI